MICDLEEQLKKQMEAVKPALEVMVGEEISFTFSGPTLRDTDQVGVNIWTNPPVDHRTPVASFVMFGVCSCPWIVMSCNAWVEVRYRGRGIGALLHRVRLVVAKAATVEQLMATVNKENDAENAIMAANDWEKVRELQHVNLWMRKL